MVAMSRDDARIRSDTIRSLHCRPSSHPARRGSAPPSSAHTRSVCRASVPKARMCLRRVSRPARSPSRTGVALSGRAGPYGRRFAPISVPPRNTLSVPPLLMTPRRRCPLPWHRPSRIQDGAQRPGCRRPTTCMQETSGAYASSAAAARRFMFERLSSLLSSVESQGGLCRQKLRIRACPEGDLACC
jgi:hypothetical protein